MQISKKTNAVFSLLGLFFILCLADAAFAASSKTDQLTNCDIQNKPCIQQIAGGRVIFDIGPKPVKAMENLIFEVKVNNINLSGPPMIDLSMPGMKMGPNPVKMEKTTNGVYRGTGIIVRCPSGKTIWQARVNLPGIGSLDFIFDVIY